VRNLVVEYASVEGVVQAPGHAGEDPPGGFAHKATPNDSEWRGTSPNPAEQRSRTMYVPAEYRAPDPPWIRDIMRRHPFALLCSNGPATPHATHVPVILRPGQPGDEATDLVGTVLVGHMSRVNPHWAALAGGCRALVVFAGPHGYVSPSIYDATPAAPTWDFTSVHVRGLLHPLDRYEDTLEVVKATVTTIESEFGAGWDMRASLPYFETILPGVGAFEVVIDSVEAMFKLSQEQEPRIRARIARSFGASDLGHHRQLADLINRMETVGAAASSAAGGRRSSPISDDISVLLVTEPRSTTITNRDPDTARTSEAVLQLQVDSRERVDELADKAFAAGALPGNDPNDLGSSTGEASTIPTDTSGACSGLTPAPPAKHP
jgi:transcriptional regulator